MQVENLVVRSPVDPLDRLNPELQRRYQMTDHQVSSLLEGAERIALKGGEHWLRPGEAADFFLLMIDGVSRIYRVDDEGTETTRVFYFAGQWGAPWGESLRGLASRSFGQAMTPMTALKIPLSWVEKRAETELPWARFMRRLIQEAYLVKEAREHEFLTASATQRYLDLIRSEPRLMEYVSLQTLATYLGITPVALSRIRGRLSN